MANREDIALELSEALSSPVAVGAPLAPLTTIRTGGAADYLVTVNSADEIRAVLQILASHGIGHVTIGSGSNLLVADAGYPGAVLRLGAGFSSAVVDGTTIEAGGSTKLAQVVRLAASEGLTGLEFAAGIPGTLGGAIAMNAGSADEWIGRVVESVDVLTEDGELASWPADAIEWGYRTTSLRDRVTVLGASLRLAQGDSAEIAATMERSQARRKATQPLNRPNAGSIFRNPEGESAGRLIESCGLKGSRVGGAYISEVHANFIVTEPGATSSDVLALMERAAGEVKSRYGIELTPEIRLIG